MHANSIQIAVRNLGSFAITLGDREPIQWKPSRCRLLFEYLLVNRNRVVLKERLCEVLWPDIEIVPGSSSLKVTVHALRRMLAASSIPPDQIQVAYQDYGYVLRVGSGVRIDYVEFEELAERARIAESRGDRDSAVALYERAIDLYQGDFLDGETADWVYEQREWLRSMALHALRFLAQDALVRGDLNGSAAYCRRMLEIDPSHEDAYRFLMTVHARRGELSAVKRWHQICVRRLREQLDVEPTEITNRVLVQALRGELLAS